MKRKRTSTITTKINKETLMKKLFFLLMAVGLCGIICGPALAQQKTIKGVIENVSEDGNYIVIGGEKIMVDPEMFQEALFTTGDELEATVEKTDQGEKLIDYSYTYNEDSSGTSSGEDMGMSPSSGEDMGMPQSSSEGMDISPSPSE